jgi:hypothetical protein
MRHEYRVAPGEGPYYCRVVDIPEGVLVVLCRADRPKGQRKLGESVFHRQMHAVLDEVHNIVSKLNRKEPQE